MRIRTIGAAGIAGLAIAVSGAGPAQAKKPVQKEAFASFTNRLAKAITTGDCATLTAIGKNSSQRFTCPRTSPQAAAGLAGFRVTAAKAYGTGGVIDYVTDAQPAGTSIEATLGYNGQWGIDQILATKRTTVGTPGRVGGFKAATRKFLGAIEKKDCTAFFTSSITVSQNKKTACRKELPLYKRLTAALKATKKPRLTSLGGNGTFYFFALRTSKPKAAYRTVAVVKTAAGASVPYLVAQTIEAKLR